MEGKKYPTNSSRALKTVVEGTPVEKIPKTAHTVLKGLQQRTSKKS